MTAGAKNKVAKMAFDLIRKIPRDKDKNPLTLEGAIRSMILKSPDYVEYRDDALNIMYCVLGTGIEWNSEGRLADVQPNNYMNPPPQAGSQGIWSGEFGLNETFAKMQLPVELKKGIIERNEREARRAVQVVNEIDLRCKTYRPDRTRWYPISWYACHLCTPMNAQEDFFLGAIETASLIAGIDPKFENDHWFEMTRTRNYAVAILKLLQHQQIYRAQKGRK